MLERGTLLAQWARALRGDGEVLACAMLEGVVRMLATMRTADTVHRDLRPENVTFMLQSLHWRLLDLSIAARIGAH